MYPRLSVRSIRDCYNYVPDRPRTSRNVTWRPVNLLTMRKTQHEIHMYMEDGMRRVISVQGEKGVEKLDKITIKYMVKKFRGYKSKKITESYNWTCAV